MRGFSCALALIFVMTAPLMILAESDIPDLKGTWVQHTSGVLHERATETSPDLHTGAKPGFYELAVMTMTIDKQEGYRFSGFKVSKDKKENVSGVIGFDNKPIYLVDDGYSFGQLVSPDKIEQIYLHITKTRSLASRQILTRER